MSIMVSHNGLRIFKPELSGHIKSAINAHIDNSSVEICVYSVGATHEHKFQDKSKLYIFNYSSQRVEGQVEPIRTTLNDVVAFFGKEIYVTDIFTPNVGGMLIKDDAGTVVAQYFPEYRTVNILIDLFHDSVTGHEMLVFEKIMAKLAEVFIDETANQSWKRAKDKSYIREETRKIIRRDFDASVSRERSNAQNKEEEIESLKAQLNAAHVSMINSMRYVNSSADAFTKEIDKILGDFEALAMMDKVEDVRVEGEYIHIFTTNLTITDPESGRQYVGGHFLIKVKMSNSDVKFYRAKGEKGHRGHWTPNDPHPHVSGNSGTACLGSVTATVAELCAQKEIYALGIVLIAFLETVNTNDTAGEKVRNWPRIGGEPQAYMDFDDVPDAEDDEETEGDGDEE